MAYKVDGKTRIQQALFDYEPSAESKDAVKRAVRAHKEKQNFNEATAGINKSPNKNAIAYFSQYEQSMTKEAAEKPFQFKRKGEVVETTVGQYVHGKVRNLGVFADKDVNTNLSFGRLIKKRIKEMDRSLDYGYGYERNRDRGDREFND
ncbi:hypothetical protein [Bacillus thuringiensis]|uniref:hypothetical protein n=1 Tax=Bacillus thuringiensis TaxID=1428 RepID=UPI0021D687EC|nr:hypothetical protein [Bacillus thuringiensis]MCU7668013.1 hypothetical protein [Bacillus thuringiensis]